MRALPRPYPLVASLALGLSIAGPAAAEEFKLVLEPEPGASPPARVCLVTRAPALRGVEVPGVSPLAAGAECPPESPGACTIRRGPPSAHCIRCPAEPHPDCRARIETGRFPVADFTAICADDDTWPADGGTVYIAVESVEAESPPALYSVEVSGGRVRWSPTNRLSHPSYRVIGGDFEASRLSWPRGREAPAWVTVPIRRRCRCLGIRKPTGRATVARARVDGGATCHGEAHPDGTLRIEVPATPSGGVRTATIETAHSEAVARWTGRWPSLDQPARLSRFDFELALACTLPARSTCPAVGARFTACDRPEPDEGVCRYTCRVDPTATLEPPVALDLRLETPEVTWQQSLDAPGLRLRGELPADRRVLTAQVPDAPLDVPGDAIQAVVVSRQGIQTNRLLLDGADALYLPMPDLQCDTPLSITYEGDRQFAVETARVQPGARVELPHPDTSAQRLQVMGSLTMIIGGKLSDLDGVTLDRATDELVELRGAVALRYRDFGSRWFVASRMGVRVVPNWLGVGGARTTDGERVLISQDQTLAAATAELLGGYVGDLLGGVSEAYLGAGVGGAYALDAAGLGADVGFIRMFVASLGVRRKLGGRLSDWSLHLEFTASRANQSVPVARAEATREELMNNSTEEVAQMLSGFEQGPAYVVWGIAGGLGLDYTF